jgi:hypothetical protein
MSLSTCFILLAIVCVVIALLAWALYAVAAREDQWREDHLGERRA